MSTACKVAFALLGIAAALGAPRIWPSAEPTDRHLRIDASQFAFDPAVVRVNHGDRVTLEVTAADVTHGVHLVGYDLAVRAEPGRRATLSFVADRRGTFWLRCLVPCGPLHPFMIGRLVVQPDVAGWWAILLAIPLSLTGLVVKRT
jgi:heme/copper-type cytochrome/quinol oxidase subunit 2